MTPPMHYHGPANAANPRNAKVADAPDLGSGGATHGGSATFRTKIGIDLKRFFDQAFVPPSTVRFAPVMYADSGLATNATRAATSSTVP